MENQLRTLLEQQLELQNQRILELRDQQRMFEQMMALLLKEKTNEVNVGTPNSESGSGVGGAGNAFKFLPNIEFPGTLEIGLRNVVDTSPCVRCLNLSEQT